MPLAAYLTVSQPKTPFISTYLKNCGRPFHLVSTDSSGKLYAVVCSDEKDRRIVLKEAEAAYALDNVIAHHTWIMMANVLPPIGLRVLAKIRYSPNHDPVFELATRSGAMYHIGTHVVSADSETGQLWTHWMPIPE